MKNAGYQKYQMAVFASAYGNFRYAKLYLTQDTAAFCLLILNGFFFMVPLASPLDGVNLQKNSHRQCIGRCNPSNHFCAYVIMITGLTI